MAKNNFFLILLLLINFNNIISMQEGDLIDTYSKPKNLNFINLPEELKLHIIGQLINIDKLNDILKKIKNAKDIFELYSLDAMKFKNELLENLKNIRLASHQLKDYAQYYIDKLRDTFIEKKLKFIEEIKNQYPNYSEDQLNNKLKEILRLGYDILNINRANLEEAARLIIAGANVNFQISSYTTLMLAAFKGYKDIVELLLNQKDINVNLRDSSLNQTALMLATAEGHKDIVELLLNQKGIDLNIQDKDRQTALIIAAKKGRKEIAKLLLNHQDIKVNMQDNNGKTALMWAAINGHKDIVKLLLNHQDVQVNTKDNEGKTALILAVYHGHKDIVELLLNHQGIDIHIKDKSGYTALTWASILNNRKPILELIKSKIE